MEKNQEKFINQDAKIKEFKDKLNKKIMILLSYKKLLKI